jgi:hypothetical protein
MLLGERANFTILQEKTAKNYLAEFPAQEADKITRSSNPAIEVKSFMLISRAIDGGEKIATAFDNGFDQVMSNQDYRDNYILNCTPF